MPWRDRISQLESVAATAVIAVIVLLAIAPIFAMLLGRLLYRGEITLFTVGESGFPVLGPAIGSIGFGISTITYFISLRGTGRDSERTMIGFLVSSAGLLAFSALAIWRLLASH